MPNGFHGSEEGWQRLAAPLEDLDGILSAYAAEHRMALSRNSRNWPDRSLTLTSDGVDRLVQIFLDDEDLVTWTFGIAASQDRDLRRYWKAESLVAAVPIAEIRARLRELLQEATARVDSWTADDLLFAVALSPI